MSKGSKGSGSKKQDDTPVPGKNPRIAHFERSFGMSTELMLVMVDNGQINPTQEIAEWVALVRK